MEEGGSYSVTRRMGVGWGRRRPPLRHRWENWKARRERRRGSHGICWEKWAWDVSGASQEQERTRVTGRGRVKDMGEENHQGALPRGHLYQRGSLDPKWPPARSSGPLGQRKLASRAEPAVRAPPRLSLKKLLDEWQALPPAAPPQPLHCALATFGMYRRAPRPVPP